MSSYNARYILLIGYFILPHHFTFFIDGNWPIIKPSDIISFLLIFFLAGKIKIDKIISLLFWIVALYFLMSVINYVDLSSFLVGVKLFQYLIVILAIKSLKVRELTKIIRGAILVNAVALIFFFAGTDLGPSWGNRFYGIYGGPYELAAITLISIIAYRHSKLLRKANFSNKINHAMLLFSQSKAALLSLVVSRKIYILLSMVLLLFFLQLSVDHNQDIRLISLITDLPLLVNSETIYSCLNLPSFQTKEQYQNLFFLREENLNIDFTSVSTGHRFVTLCTILSSFDLWSFTMGFGPYVVGTIDNSILRLLADVGLLGLILLFLFLRNITQGWSGLEKIALTITLLLSDVLFSARLTPYLYVCYLLYTLDSNKFPSLKNRVIAKLIKSETH